MALLIEKGTTIASASDIIRNGIRFIESAALVTNKLSDVDSRFIDPKIWKLNKSNQLTNTWCTFHIGEMINNSVSDTINLKAFTKDLTSRFGRDEDAKSVTVFGVDIKLSSPQKSVETVVNSDTNTSSVIQYFANPDFDITINFVLNAPVYWQQNSFDLEVLSRILKEPAVLGIINPQLNIIYGITKVSIKSFSIGQDGRVYSKTPISIKCKSIKNEVDILTLTTDN